jgi:hypothetical protein
MERMAEERRREVVEAAADFALGITDSPLPPVEDEPVEGATDAATDAAADAPEATEPPTT